jgi:enediyne biosynthesis thioesterase
VLAALTTGFTMVTTTCSCEFLDELTANDRVELRMTLRALDFSRIVMDFEYFRLGVDLPRLVARGSQTVACMARGPAGLTPEPVPAELRSALSSYLSFT